MASMKPHNLPYTKKGLFGVVGPQGLTGIGTRVGQSVSGLFASLSTGISSNLLPASLRITNEEAQLMMKEDQKEGQEALETGTKEKRRITDTSTNANDNLRDVDDGPELPASTQFATLYSRFQMSDEKSEEPVESQEPEGKGRESQKQRMARRKVWALNRNGRVDFSIQEYVKHRDSEAANLTSAGEHWTLTQSARLRRTLVTGPRRTLATSCCPRFCRTPTKRTRTRLAKRYSRTDVFKIAYYHTREYTFCHFINKSLAVRELHTK